MKMRYYAKVFPTFSAVGLLEQLNGCVSFIVVFKFSDISVQFLIPLQLRNDRSSLGDVARFTFWRRQGDRSA